MKIYEYANQWLQDHIIVVRQSTAENYAYAIKRFQHFFEDQELSELSKSNVAETFRKMSAQGLSRSSIYNVRQVFRAIYRSAQSQHLIDNNPFSNLPLPADAQTKLVDAYSLEEMHKLIMAAAQDTMGDSFVFMMMTGLRLHEVINLKWEDYNSERHIIYIRQSKTARGVAQIAISQLAEIILQRQPVYEHGYVFSNLHKQPLSKTSMRKLLYRLRELSGVTDATNHRCRHTFCTLMIEAGADAKTVSTLARHSSVAFTMQRYVTCNIDRQRKELGLLDNIFANVNQKRKNSIA